MLDLVLGLIAYEHLFKHTVGGPNLSSSPYRTAPCPYRSVFFTVPFFTASGTVTVPRTAPHQMVGCGTDRGLQ